MAEAVVKRGNKGAVSDGLIAAMLARTAVVGALFNVKINLASIKDESYVSELGKKVEKLEIGCNFFVKNQFCVFPNCQTQYIIDNIHSLSGKFTGGSSLQKIKQITFTV